MSKRIYAPKICDQIATGNYRGKRDGSQALLPALPASRVRPGKSKKVNYIPGTKPQEEPVDMPRLAIRGFGGSIKTDLRGLGVELSPEAFAQLVSDKSLECFDIHRGDIAMIDPRHQIQRVGNLILVMVDGREAWRVVTRINRVWYIETPGSSPTERVLLSGLVVYGVVIGVTRLFTKVRPKSFDEVRGNILPNTERSKAAVRRSVGPVKVPTLKIGKTRYANPKKVPFLLMAESDATSRLTEKVERPSYKSRTNRRCK